VPYPHTAIFDQTSVNNMDAFIVDGVRTPIGNFGGSLAPVRTDDLAAIVLEELLKRNSQLDPAVIGDVLLGCANQAGEDNRNVARMALLIAGFPHSVPGETVNRLCASGMAATVNASRMLACGDSEVVVAGGVEHMTRGPWVMSKASKAFGRDSKLHDTSFGWRFVNPRLAEVYGVDGMGETAENLVDQYGISRADQDSFSAWSQRKAAQSVEERAEECVAVSIPRRKQEPMLFNEDEFIKPQTSLKILGKLRPAFRPNGSVTAGNASGLNDGAAALLLASKTGLSRYGLKAMTRICSSAVVGVEPRVMGIGPVGASRLALKRAGLNLNDMDLIELNEAFAAQSLACTRSLGLEDFDSRLNPQGGAIALGHPLGMTGARLLLTASKQLVRAKKRYALVTLCIGVGQGYAVVLENVQQ